MIFDPIKQIYQSPLLLHAGLQHLTTTRNSFGQSDFNLSRKQQTALERDKKISIIQKYLHSELPIIFPKQISGDDIWHVTEELAIQDADAVITSRKDIALGILTADCLPIILYEPQQSLLALVHAGWRGIHSNLVGKTLKQLTSLGANPKNILASVGPSIGPEVYEVGTDVAQLFNTKGYSAFLKPLNNEKFLLNLWGIAEIQMMEEGLHSSNIELSGLCSFTNSMFYSARREGPSTGRFATIATLTK